MTLLLVTGMMNLGAIVLVAAAITVERLAPRPERVTRALGAVISVLGAFLIVRGLGAV
jgi:predicted metal-binding membrane protein